MEITLGTSASVVRTVGEQDTAAAVGSGDLPVLGTPVLLAWLEAAAVEVCGSSAEQTSVGARAGIDHLRPSPVGARLTCTATVAEVDGPMVTFKVSAVQSVNGEEVLVGRGLVTRAVVERERFMSRATL
jgi:fluoroacetyl-CoA thioesterase